MKWQHMIGIKLRQQQEEYSSNILASPQPVKPRDFKIHTKEICTQIDSSII